MPDQRIMMTDEACDELARYLVSEPQLVGSLSRAIQAAVTAWFEALETAAETDDGAAS